jgi:ArsR family transcriptional regulator
MAKKLSAKTIDKIAERFRLLGETNRLRLLSELRDGELSVSELVHLTGLSQPNTSRQLQALFKGGIIGRKKIGLSVYYFISDLRVLELCKVVCDCLEDHHLNEAKSFRSTPKKKIR